MQFLALDTCYVFIKSKLNMEWNVILIVLTEFPYLGIPKDNSRFDEYPVTKAGDELECMLVCGIIRFFFICLKGKQIS